MHHGNDHRIGSRVMLPAAAPILLWSATAHLPAPGDVGGSAADGTEAVASMPAQLRPCLGHDARIRAAQVLGGSAGVLEGQSVLLNLFALHRGNVNHEMGYPVNKSQEDGFGFYIESPQIVNVKPTQFLFC